MKPAIGFVSLWQNRGQAQVTRQIRSIFDDAGYPTYVLARPSPDQSTMPNLIKQDSVWDAPGITRGSEFNIPPAEYLEWVRAHDIKMLFCDMNFQFGALRQVRNAGVIVAGRFVWERLGMHQRDEMLAAYDVVYALTRAEHVRYQQMGVASVKLSWGIHPELLAYQRAYEPQPETVRFLFHGGMLGRRKPVEKSVAAVMAQPERNIQLTVKSQATHKCAEQLDESDSRVQHLQSDPDFEAYQEMLADQHVLLAPSRWEGLGVHLFESVAHGTPVISTDIAPIDEVIHHGYNGLLAPATVSSYTRSGLAIMEPDQAGLTECVSRICDPRERRRLARGQREMRDYLRWEKTQHDYLALAKSCLA